MGSTGFPRLRRIDCYRHRRITDCADDNQFDETIDLYQFGVHWHGKSPLTGSRINGSERWSQTNGGIGHLPTHHWDEFPKG